MRVVELLENDDSLEEFKQLLQLRATESKISMVTAQVILNWMNSRGYKFIFSDGKTARKGYEPVGRPYLKINSSTWKNKSWRSGKGAMERGYAYTFLRDAGYKVAGWESQVRDGINDAELPWLKRAGNTPHLFFW